MALPYSNSTTGETAKVARTSHQILQDVDALVRDLRKEIRDERAKIDRKFRFAAYGALTMGGIAFFMPDKYQDSVAAWVTYISFGAALGVLLG